MLTPCEAVLKGFLPGMKASVSKLLVNEYGFSQTEAAEKLGLTQAAVSKYLSGDYSNEIKKLERNKLVREKSQLIAREIVEKKVGKKQVSTMVCDTCSNLSPELHCVFKQMLQYD